MKTVNFQFELGDKVTTPFGDPGLVSMLGVNDGGNCYYIKTQAGGNWFKERELTK